MERAIALGATHLATGHYARVTCGEDGFELRKAADANKDQSYVLYGLGQHELSRLLLPVGDYTKPEIRALAREAGLLTADKPESMEICFIPDNDYRRFVAERTRGEPGPLVLRDGTVIGEHRGIAFYTVGQRHGLGLATGDKLYVLEIRPDDNTVVVGPEAALYSDGLLAEDLRWVSGVAPVASSRVEVKVRYKAGAASGTIEQCGAIASVRFDQPQRAVTPGQPVVFYQGDRALGGGVIAAPYPELR